MKHLFKGMEKTPQNVLMISTGWVILYVVAVVELELALTPDRRKYEKLV